LIGALTIVVSYLIITVHLLRRYRVTDRMVIILATSFPVYLLFSYIIGLAELFASPGDYYDLVSFISLLSAVIGVSALGHCFVDRHEMDLFWKLRFTASVMLILVPATFLIPKGHVVVAVALIMAGGILGAYGYHEYSRNGSRQGLVYISLSTFLMVIGPVVSITLMNLYNQFNETLTYRRSATWVTCHLPAYPMYNPETMGYMTVFYAIHGVFLGIIARVRRFMLINRLEGEGLIPESYRSIIEGDGNDDDEE